MYIDERYPLPVARREAQTITTPHSELSTLGAADPGNPLVRSSILLMNFSFSLFNRIFSEVLFDLPFTIHGRRENGSLLE